MSKNALRFQQGNGGRGKPNGKGKARAGHDPHKEKVERGEAMIQADQVVQFDNKLRFHVQPKTENQRKYMFALRNNKLVVAMGSAGTGKTFVAAWWAAKMYSEGRVDKIFITRPNVSMGRDTGSLPGSELEKILPFVMPMLEVLKKSFGEARFQYMIDKKVIEVAPVEKIRGRSFENCVIICDESQNVKPQHIESVVTRLGENAQMILCGDSHQHDLQGLTGIEYVVNIIRKYAIEDAAVVEFFPQDCVRSGITRAFLLAFEQEWKEKNGKRYE
jgi:phosphate starvation-inducible protein PhoH and related proteins